MSPGYMKGSMPTGTATRCRTSQNNGWVKLPVRCEDRSLGRLEVYGRHVGENSLASLSLLAELMESLQPEFSRLLSEVPAVPLEPVHRGKVAQVALPNHSIGTGHEPAR